jgi:hypothetical protein
MKKLNFEFWDAKEGYSNERGEDLTRENAMQSLSIKEFERLINGEKVLDRHNTSYGEVIIEISIIEVDDND